MTVKAVGFLWLDARMQPIGANAEAGLILGFPVVPRDAVSLNDIVGQTILEPLAPHKWTSPTLVTRFVSGRRNYVCRAFRMDRTLESGIAEVAVVLERPPWEGLIAQQVGSRFNLTQREQETVQFLMLGLTSKEIAARMQISPNTVKAFIHTIMLKMQTTTRTGVLGRILESMSRQDNSDPRSAA